MLNTKVSTQDSLKIFNNILFLSLLMVGSHAHAETADDFFNRPQIKYAQPQNLLGWIDSRKQISLNGEWNYIVDPLKNGLPGESFFSDFASNKKPQSAFELIEYDFANAPKIRVPADWNSQYENLFFYQGGLWYHKEFEHELTNNERTHLYIEGSNFATKVFLNGKPIGEFLAGYTAFDFDISEAVKEGLNTLIVFVDAALDKNTVPTYKTDWWLYGGIIGDVSIVSLPEAFVRNAKVQLNKLNANLIDVFIEGNINLANQAVVVKVPELGIDRQFQFNEFGLMSAQIPFTGNYWDLDNPKLYEVIIETKFESIKDQIGFRTIEIVDNEIMLNKKPIIFKGISSHAEPIAEKGIAFSSNHFNKILAEVSELGGNFLRAAHYPYSRHLAKEADRLGILLWEEIPVYWNINWNNEQTYAIANQQLTRMVSRDWNRASVVVWSVGNETPYSENRMKFLSRLIDETRELDNSRLLSAALLGGSAQDFQNLIVAIAALGMQSDIPTPREKIILEQVLKNFETSNNHQHKLIINLDDPIGHKLDIVALNEYFGWYYSVFLAPQINISEKTFRLLMLQLLPEIKLQNSFNKPIHLSEFGAGAKYGIEGEGIWSENYQAMVYTAQIEMIKNNQDTVKGYSPWILKDFRSMMRPLSGIQDFYNRKGLMDEKGNKKDAYYILQSFYNSKE